jgi:hypothetical protein
MPRAEAREWWADVEDVRERIERRRALESSARRENANRTGGSEGAVAGSASAFPIVHRGVREIRPGRRLMLVETAAPPTTGQVRRKRRRPPLARRVGPRPDMIAAWAVALGVSLVVVAILSAHG